MSSSQGFLHKYKKWKGCDKEVAEQKWNEFVRDSNVRRKLDVDGEILLACPVVGTSYHIKGHKIADHRSVQETTTAGVGDADAIREVRDSTSAMTLDT